MEHLIDSDEYGRCTIIKPNSNDHQLINSLLTSQIFNTHKFIHYDGKWIILYYRYGVIADFLVAHIRNDGFNPNCDYKLYHHVQVPKDMETLVRKHSKAPSPCF